MKLFRVVLLLVGIASQSAVAQELEFGVMGGSAGYVGDINTNNPLLFSGISGGGFFRYNYNNLNAIRASITYATVNANDANSSYKEQQLRNLNFNSEIFEVAGLYEFNFLKYLPKSKKFPFAPYTSVGLSVFKFDPKTTYQGKTYLLQPLGTEGDTYSTISFAFLYGLGVKYNFGGAFTVGVDLLYRYALTDRLDDVSGNYASPSSIQEKHGAVAAALADRSGEVNNGVNIGAAGTQRGDNSRNDQYFTGMITLSYTILRNRCPEF